MATITPTTTVTTAVTRQVIHQSTPNIQRSSPPTNRTTTLLERARARRGVLLALRAGFGLDGALALRLGATRGGFFGPVVLIAALLGLVCLGQFIMRDRKSRDPARADRDFRCA